MTTKIVEINLPEYQIKEKPDYLKIGKVVDREIENNFSDGVYILRAISLDEHKGKNIEDLSEIIIKTGTDKYDPNRKGVCHGDFCNYDYDIQAGTIEIKDSKLVIEKSMTVPSEFGDIAYHFYEHTMLDRGYAVRIDLLLIYDLEKLELARKIDQKLPDVHDGLDKYLYKFKDSNNKKSALLGLVKILR